MMEMVELLLHWTMEYRNLIVFSRPVAFCTFPVTCFGQIIRLDLGSPLFAFSSSSALCAIEEH